MIQKSENQSPKMQWTQQIRKRPKKVKILLYKCRYDNNKLTKIWSKKRKSKPKKKQWIQQIRKRPKKSENKGPKTKSQKCRQQ